MNRDPSAVIDALQKAHKRNPNFRLGQIILNAVIDCPDTLSTLFYMENDELAEAIRREFGGEEQ